MNDLERPGDGDASAGATDAGATGLVVSSAVRNIAVVRRYAVDACVALGWGDSSDTVALLVSEVATNAVLHAYGTELRVVVLDRGMRLRVEVFEGSPGLPVPRRGRLDAEDGRALALLDALAVAWGVDARADGKNSWFEIGL